MKNQALFSSKDKSKKIKCRLLQFLLGALRVKLTSSGYVWHDYLGKFEQCPGIHRAIRRYVLKCIMHIFEWPEK